MSSRVSHCRHHDIARTRKFNLWRNAFGYYVISNNETTVTFKAKNRKEAEQTLEALKKWTRKCG